MAAKALGGLTLDQVSERVTRWYEANRGRRDAGNGRDLDRHG
jgi:hypothetical protein